MSNHKKKFLKSIDVQGVMVLVISKEKSIPTSLKNKKKLFTAFKKYYTEHGHAPSVRMLAAIEMEGSHRSVQQAHSFS